MTQVDAMLRDLRAGLGVTPLTALERYGCLSLSQRISELKGRGFIFSEGWVALPNKKKVKEFFLAFEPPQEAA